MLQNDFKNTVYENRARAIFLSSFVFLHFPISLSLFSLPSSLVSELPPLFFGLNIFLGGKRRGRRKEREKGGGGGKRGNG